MINEKAAIYMFVMKFEDNKSPKYSNLKINCLFESQFGQSNHSLIFGVIFTSPIAHLALNRS